MVALDLGFGRRSDRVLGGVSRGGKPEGKGLGSSGSRRTLLGFRLRSGASGVGVFTL